MKYGILGLAVAAAWYTVRAPEKRPAVRVHEQQGERWTWSGRMAEGRTLEVRGINGSVRAEPAGGDRAEVSAEKRGRRDDPDEVSIEVVEHDGGVTICAVYPGRSNECRPGGGGMNVRNNDVEVRFTVKVPSGVRFDGNTVNGDIETAELSGPVELHTVNGSIQLATSSGDAEAQTVNGGITASVGQGGTSPLRFRTVNGAITVTLPSGLGADLDVQTVSGSIQSDFAVQVQGRMSPRRLAGRIGDGGRALDLTTVNGPIRLRQRP